MSKKYLIPLAVLCAMVQGAWGQTNVATAGELTEAIGTSAGSREVRLTADITLSSYLKIGESAAQTVTIDLAGHTLSRSGLGSASSNGHVIEVCTQGTLTLTGGTLSGGWANDGGGIKNESGASLTISGGSITGCRSNAGGGAVVNYGTANISNCTLSNNTVTTRGGIWNNGTLNMQGNIAVRNNTGDDVYLKSDKVITVTGGPHQRGEQHRRDQRGCFRRHHQRLLGFRHRDQSLLQQQFQSCAD